MRISFREGKGTHKSRVRCLDSQYVLNVIDRDGWQAGGWRRKRLQSGRPVTNEPFDLADPMPLLRR